jgi:hypothetical protein
MITNLTSPIARKDEGPKGISRSRFSFHFNTARKRHWLLVQFVTAPALPAGDEPQQPTTNYTQQPERTDYNYLVDSFQASRIATRCI